MQDEIAMLNSFGITMPSPAYVVALLVFSVIGIIAFAVGRRRRRPVTTWTGLALMLYPYVVWSTLGLWVVGVALCGVLVYDQR